MDNPTFPLSLYGYSLLFYLFHSFTYDICFFQLVSKTIFKTKHIYKKFKTSTWVKVFIQVSCLRRNKWVHSKNFSSLTFSSASPRFFYLLIFRYLYVSLLGIYVSMTIPRFLSPSMFILLYLSLPQFYPPYLLFQLISKIVFKTRPVSKKLKTSTWVIVFIQMSWSRLKKWVHFPKNFLLRFPLQLCLFYFSFQFILRYLPVSFFHGSGIHASMNHRSLEFVNFSDAKSSYRGQVVHQKKKKKQLN